LDSDDGRRFSMMLRFSAMPRSSVALRCFRPSSAAGDSVETLRFRRAASSLAAVSSAPS
jgi:hypothetical protein